MAQDDSELAALRAEIDKLDEVLLEALSRRMEVVADIARAKAKAQPAGRNAAGPLRPGREAQLLRRLLDRRQGPAAPALILAVWREILASAVAMQGPLEAVVLEGTGDQNLARTAQLHFGASTPIGRAAAVDQALEQAAARPGCVAVLPAAQAELRSWWPALAAPSARNAGLRVFAKTPFLADAEAALDLPGAYLAGAVAPAASGDDVTLLALTSKVDGPPPAAAPPGEARLLDEADDRDQRRRLFALDGFFEEDGPDMAALRRSLGDGATVSVIGAYARPYGVKSENDL